MSLEPKKIDGYMDLLGKSVLANRRLRGKGVIRDDEVMALTDVLRDWKAFHEGGDGNPKTVKELLERARALELRFRERGLKFINEADGHEALAAKLGIVSGRARSDCYPAELCRGLEPWPADHKPSLKDFRARLRNLGDYLDTHPPGSNAGAFVGLSATGAAKAPLSKADKDFVSAVLVKAAKASSPTEWCQALAEDNWRALHLLNEHDAWNLSPQDMREMRKFIEECSAKGIGPGVPGGVPKGQHLERRGEPGGRADAAPPAPPGPAPNGGNGLKVAQGTARKEQKGQSGTPGGAPTGPEKGPTVSPFGQPGGKPDGLPGGIPGSDGGMPWGSKGWGIKLPWWGWALAAGGAFLVLKDND